MHRPLFFNAVVVIYKKSVTCLDKIAYILFKNTTGFPQCLHLWTILAFLSIVRGINVRKQEHALAAPGACGVTRASRGLELTALSCAKISHYIIFPQAWAVCN